MVATVARTCGIHSYPDARNILILCDAGGKNSYRHQIFKIKLLELAKELGIVIVIAHYPPYSLKYNSIEHRLFCHVHNTIKGIVFSSYNILKELMEKHQPPKDFVLLLDSTLLTMKKGSQLINLKWRLREYFIVKIFLNYRIK